MPKSVALAWAGMPRPSATMYGNSSGHEVGNSYTSLPGSGVSPNTVQIRRGDKRGRTKTKRQSRWHTQAITFFNQERTCLMIVTIPENGLQDKVCQHLSLGLLQEVLPVSQIEELLETYQMWEQRERKLNMVAMVYFLLGLHLYPQLSQRAVYAKLVSGLRTMRDDVPEAIPSN